MTPATLKALAARLRSTFIGEVSDAAKEAAALLEQIGVADAGCPTIEAARTMGEKGGPVVEGERLAFEAWMAGHCWKVSPTWNGREYDDCEEDKKRKLLDPLARTTRMLWAAWRDRAALAQATPSDTERGLYEALKFSERQLSSMDADDCCTIEDKLALKAARAALTAYESKHGSKS